MEWTEEHDNYLYQEILVLEPFKYKKGSISRGQIWEKIANNLNGLKLPRFKVSKHAVRQRYHLLSEKFKAKMKDEEKASVIRMMRIMSATPADNCINALKNMRCFV